MNMAKRGLQPSARRVGLLFLLLVFAVLAVKALNEGWFAQRQPLLLNGEPALLFFNRSRGCPCAMTVYLAAKYQVQNWSAEERRGVQILSFDLDLRPDLGKQYDVVRAPTLLFVVDNEKTVLRQDEVVSDDQPLDLVRFEQKIREVLDGN